MREEWRWFTVQQLQDDGILLVEDGNHGEYRPRPSEFVEDGVAKFVRATDMTDGRILFDAANSISDVALARIRKGIGQPGDILFSHKGTVGKLAVAPNDAEPFVCSPQTTFWRVLKPLVLDPGFLYTFMRSPLFVRQWHVRKGETDMADYVSLTAQRRLKVPLPEYREQRRLAATVNPLDRSIENNRRRIGILVEMARLIYREWFVHFRFPGHEDIELVDSDLGLIPEGWDVGEVGDVIRLQRGFDLPVDHRNTAGDVPVLAASGVHGCHDEAKVVGPGVTTGRSGTIGPVTYVQDDFWPLNTVLWVKEYRRSSPVHAFFFLESLDLMGLSGGAAVPTLNRNHVHARKLPVPPQGLVREYDAVAAPMFELRTTLHRQNNILAEARDVLLPRLISGELDVSGLDPDLESVA